MEEVQVHRNLRKKDRYIVSLFSYEVYRRLVQINSVLVFFSLLSSLLWTTALFLDDSSVSLCVWERELVQK